MGRRKLQIAAADAVTILVTKSGKLATKRFVKAENGSVQPIPYDAGTWYGVLPPWPVDGIQSLSKLLSALEGIPQGLVIRGEPVDPLEAATHLMRRLGSGVGASFQGNFRTPDHGRHYVMIDVDKMPLPKKLRLDRRTVTKVCEYVVSKLPNEFQDVSYHWQLSSSAGFGDPNVVSLHLWFWLVTPVADAELRRWGEFVNHKAGFSLIDTALFRHVQPHYTAAPIFSGVQDPFPTRSGLMCLAKDSVDIVLPPNQVLVTITSPTQSVSSNVNAAYPTSGFSAILSSMGDHPGGEGFRGPLLRAAASYVATNGADKTDREVLYLMLSSAVLKADCSKHTPSEIVDRSSRATIMPMIDSAIRKFGNKPAFYLPHTKTGIAPVKNIGSIVEKDPLVAQVSNFFSF